MVTARNLSFAGSPGVRSRLRASVLLAVLPLLGCSPDIEADTNGAPGSAAALSTAPDIHWTVTAAGGPFAFSPDGATVATGGPAQIKLLSAATGAIQRTLRVRGTPLAAAFSPDGTLLAAGTLGVGLNLRLFRVSDGTRLFQTAAHNNGTTSVAFSPTAAGVFATAGRDRTTKIWRTDGTLLRTMNDGKRVLAMAYSPDGAFIASNNDTGVIHIWRASDGALVRSIPATNHRAIAYSPDGILLSTGTELFDAATGTRLRTLNWPASGSVTSTAFTRDGAAVVVGGEDFPDSVDVATIRYFRVSDGATLVTFDQIGGDHAFVAAVAVSPDGASLGYTVATDDLTVLATSPF